MMIIALLIKFIFMLRIHMKENINSLFKNVKNRLEDLRDLKTFIEYPNHIQDVYNPSKK